MPFKYKVPRRGRRPNIVSRRPSFAKDEEQLTGQFRGMKASDIEERFGNSLQRNRRIRNVYFRVPVGAPRGMPGWKELDFLVETYSGWRAFQTDDVEFVHVGSDSRDALTDVIILEALRRDGIYISRVERIQSIRITDDEQSDQTVRELIG